MWRVCLRSRSESWSLCVFSVCVGLLGTKQYTQGFTWTHWLQQQSIGAHDWCIQKTTQFHVMTETKVQMQKSRHCWWWHRRDSMMTSWSCGESVQTATKQGQADTVSIHVTTRLKQEKVACFGLWNMFFHTWVWISVLKAFDALQMFKSNKFSYINEEVG